MSDYCWMFGEHKGDPCPCGYPSTEEQKIRALRHHNAQLKGLAGEMFQALAAVLGDDEHRGHVTQITIESCRNAVSHWLEMAYPKENK